MVRLPCAAYPLTSSITTKQTWCFSAQSRAHHQRVRIYLVSNPQHYAFGSDTRPIAVSIATSHASAQASTSVCKASQRARVEAGDGEMPERNSHILPHKSRTNKASVPSVAANRRSTKRAPSLDITSPQRLRVLGTFTFWRFPTPITPQRFFV